MTRDRLDGVTFRLFARGVTILMPAAAAPVVAARLPAYAGPAVKSNETYRLSCRDGRWIVELFPPHSDGFASLHEAAEALEYFVMQRLLSLAGDRIQLHAAGVRVASRAVLALGPSDAGKSSLAFHWSRAGLPVFGDDVVFLDPDGTACAFKRLFNVKRARFRADGVAPAGELNPVVDPYEAWYDPGVDAGWAEPAPVSLVVRPAFEAGTGVTTTPLTGPAVLDLLLSSVLPSGQGAPEAFDCVAGVSRRARGVAVTYGDASRAADAIAELAAREGEGAPA